MPMYEFQCEPCDHGFEALVRGPGDVPRCPRCEGTTLVKRFSVPAAARANAGAGAGASASLPMARPSSGGGCGAPWCGTGGCGGMG